MAKADLRNFDYKKVAKLDAAMWRSYYNHQFFKMFLQLMKTMRSQLHLSWFLTFKLAWHSGVAATKYRLRRGREDYNSTARHLTAYYRIISNSCAEPFDFKKAAKLELEWWDIHRYPKKYKKGLEQSLAEAQAVVYGLKADRLMKYARYRAEAMMLPNHTSDRHSPTDWQKVEALLIKSWSELHAAVQK